MKFSNPLTKSFYLFSKDEKREALKPAQNPCKNDDDCTVTLYGNGCNVKTLCFAKSNTLKEPDSPTDHQDPCPTVDLNECEKSLYAAVGCVCRDSYCGGIPW
jgi:hypothetical protein